MSIRRNNSSGVISVAITDTTILQNTSQGRWTVSNLKAHDYGNTGDTVEIFISDDASSAAGERVDLIVLAPNETKQSLFAPFNVESGMFLIANALVGDLLNVEAIYTTHTGDS